MDDPLEKAKEVLKDLEGDLESAKTIWEDLRKLNPNFEQLSEKNWVEKQARCWLHGAIEIEGAFPILLVPTFFGDRPIRISWRVAKFLQALSLIPSTKPRETILQSPLRSLTRTFEDALETISPNPEFGNISYVSLLSPPDHSGAYRYQPK